MRDAESLIKNDPQNKKTPPPTGVFYEIKGSTKMASILASRQMAQKNGGCFCETPFMLNE